MKERNSSTLGEKKIGPSPREKQNKTEKTTKKKKSLLGIAVGGSKHGWWPREILLTSTSNYDIYKLLDDATESIGR